MKKSLIFVVSIFMVLSLVLSACVQKVEEPTQAPVVEEPTEEPVVEEPTEEPVVEEPTEAPTEEPTEEPVVEEPAGLTCAEPVKIGLITDRTGLAQYYGAWIVRSFMLGMEYLAGAPGTAGDVFAADATENTFKVDNCEIQVFVRDDASTADITTAVASELIDVQQVDFLVGTASSITTAVLQGMAAQNQIPLIVAPAAANDITGVNFNEYTFRVSRNNYQDAINECKALTANYTKLINFAVDYPFGYGSAAAFRDACTLDGATFVADDIYAPITTTDFTTYMEQIAATDAEAFIVTWLGAMPTAMMEAAKDQGVFETKVLGTTFIDNISTPIFYSDAIGTVAGVLYHWSAPDNPINDYLVEQTAARYAGYPDLFDADGMNAAIMIVETLKKTNGDVTPEVLLAAMEGLEFEGPKGKVYIRPEDHVAIQDMYVLKLENVTDPTGNFYSYINTTRPEPPCLLPETLKDRCGDLPYGSLTGN